MYVQYLHTYYIDNLPTERKEYYRIYEIESRRGKKREREREMMVVEEEEEGTRYYVLLLPSVESIE